MDPLHEASTETKYFYLPNVAARDQTLLPVLISVKGGYSMYCNSVST